MKSNPTPERPRHIVKSHIGDASRGSGAIQPDTSRAARTADVRRVESRNRLTGTRRAVVARRTLLSTLFRTRTGAGAREA